MPLHVPNPRPYVVHTAAQPVGLVQRCLTCNFVIRDNTAWGEGRVAVLEGDTRGPGWWPTGARVGTDKTDERRPGLTYVLQPEGRPLAADERPCPGP